MRWVAVLLFIVSVWYGTTASNFTSSTLGDPLGPGVFPLILALALGITSVVLFIRTTEKITVPAPFFLLNAGKVVACLIAYALCLEWLGFVVTTSFVMFLLALIFKGPWVLSLVGGILFSLTMYILFVIVLDLRLPMGVWGG